MTDRCRYSGNRDEALIAYLYDGDQMAREAFDAHLASCAVCRDELDALRGVRTMLGQWAPPEPSFLVASPESRIPNPESRVIRGRWWNDAPAWAQVAAALLFLGVSAGLANLDVRYDQSGLTVRTGWMKGGVSQPPVAPVAQPPSQSFGEPRRSSPETRASGGGDVSPAHTVTRDDLMALERQLRSEFRGAQGSMRTAMAADATPAHAASNDAELLRRVRALLDESEKRQQRELALRVGQLLQDVHAQRQADLVRIDRSLGVVENNLGAEVLKQRQSLNLLYRASLRQ